MIKRTKLLLIDLMMFIQIVLYWPFVFLVMIPMKYFDEIFGTKILKRTINLMKIIAND